MSHVVKCPVCGSRVSYVSSDIGSIVACTKCGEKFEAPVPEAVDREFKERDEAYQERKRAYEAKWGNYDHIANPVPKENPNGFWDALRKYAAERGLKSLSEKIKEAGIYGSPESEHFSTTFFIINSLTEDDIRSLPESVVKALIRYRTFILSFMPELARQHAKLKSHFKSKMNKLFDVDADLAERLFERWSEKTLLTSGQIDGFLESREVRAVFFPVPEINIVKSYSREDLKRLGVTLRKTADHKKEIFEDDRYGFKWQETRDGSGEPSGRYKVVEPAFNDESLVAWRK